MIDNYEFGSITINGKTYNNDVIIRAEEFLNDKWWRKEGHDGKDVVGAFHLTC
jgi:hypothetical protein